MNIADINWDSALMVVGFGLLMVFLILVLLVVIIKIFGLFFAPIILIKKPQRKSRADNIPLQVVEEYEESHLTASCSAAIAMALHLYYDEDVHDIEKAIVTIKKVEKRYSPWSSKIYGLTNLVK
jgi:Na+-transporting methylmalonyl-CoA/oxaloacetate decarboxylase gamma subunit